MLQFQSEELIVSLSLLGEPENNAALILRVREDADFVIDPKELEGALYVTH